VNYSEAIQFLYGLQMFGANFGLERAQKLAALAGNPQEELRFIHVAGTNGKGSTCAMLESIYRAAGLRVGLFTSPHLVSFRERIQINRELISENEIVRLITEIRPLLKNFPTENHPTMFEVVTVLALKFFAEQKCDLVIWETGLGGRLDATNIVTPLISVITNIALDHQQWLGDTLGKIASEKAGIIKNGIPVVTGVNEPEALAVIEQIAKEKNSSLVKVGSGFSIQSSALSLRSKHQKQNAALALATVEILQKQIPVSAEQIQTGLKSVNWPGRLQLIEKPNGQKILLDGAHNLAGAEALCAAIGSIFPASKVTLILGILEDKDWRHICEKIALLASRILLVPVASKRTADPRNLVSICQAANPTAEINVVDSLTAALDKSATDDLVLITGSLYLVGEALERLGLSPTAESERALNEWNAAHSAGNASR